MSECEIIVKMDKHLKLKGGHYVQDLVRCEDCKWWDNEDNAERCTHEYGAIWAKSDGYCSYGERADT